MLNKIYCTARGVVGALHITIVVACVQFVSGFHSICTQNFECGSRPVRFERFHVLRSDCLQEDFSHSRLLLQYQNAISCYHRKEGFSTLHADLFEVHRSCLQPCGELKYQKKMHSFVLATHSAGLKVWPCKLPEHISCSSASFPERHSKTCHSMPMDLCDLARLCALWTELAAQPFCSPQRLE